jgi:hypothetical protein
MKAKKVSFNQATAKSTERHNDRSMYKHGYEERSNNWHWDLYDCGSSFEAEARFYGYTFKPTLEAQNAKALAMRKYDRVMDMATWHGKHQPKEAIVQLGDVDNNDTSREFAEGAAKKMVKAIEAAGGIVLSIDLHVDERTIDEDGNEIVGTPHLHIRYVFLVENKDGNPVIDMKNALLAHGIERPDPSKPTSKTNNPAQTFLEQTRTMLEDYADEVELAHGNPRVNRKRERRSHSSVQQYKQQKRVEELERQANEAIATRDAALAEAAAERQRLDLRASEVARGEEANKREAERLNRLSEALRERDEQQDEREQEQEEREQEQDERDEKQDDRDRELNRRAHAVIKGEADNRKRADALDERDADITEREGLFATLKKQVLALLAKLTGEVDRRLLEEMKQQAGEIKKTVVQYDGSLDEDEPREDERSF